MTRTNVFRDGEVHVQARKCDTCIYRPGNLMHLEPGRKDGMQAEAVAGSGVIPCHKTLGSGKEAVCRGYFDVVKHEGTSLLQAAARLGIVVEDEEMLT
jgi:hypothetical protein